MDICPTYRTQLRDPIEAQRVEHAIRELQSRCLVKSASWLSQLYMAMSSFSSGSSLSKETDGSLSEQERSKLQVDNEASWDPCYNLAKSYFETHQHQRAAHCLRKSTSSQARFLRMYSVFIFGEKKKDEERQQVADASEPENTELDQLKEELLTLKKQGALDAHLCYLLAVVLKRLKLQDEAISSFKESLRMFPYNWGAWLELSTLLDSKTKLQSISLENHWTSSVFVGYCMNELSETDSAMTIFEGLMDALPNCTFFKRQYAFGLYNACRFDEAQHVYDELYEADPYSLEGMDVYSNLLYVLEDKVQLSLLAKRCMKIDKFTLETCCVIGNYYSLQRDHEQAVTYFQRALKLNRNYLPAWTLMGHEFLEMKNTAAAVEAYRRAIDINPKDSRAWYGLGQTYELLTMPLYTLYYYQKAASLRPKDNRMWCALGRTYEGLTRLVDAAQCYERARECNSEDSSALSKLAYLYTRMASAAPTEGRSKKVCNMLSERAAQYHLDNLKLKDHENIEDTETAEALKFLAQHYYFNASLKLAEKYCYRLMNFPGHEKEFAKRLIRLIYSKRANQ